MMFFNGSGGSRTRSILRSKRGWSANCLPSREHSHPSTQYPVWDSNPQAPGFKPGRSAIGVPGRFEAEAVGLEPTSGSRAATCFQDRPLIRPDGFREDSRSEFRGLESNQRPPRSGRGVTTTSNCPGVREGGLEPPPPGSKPGSLPLADSRECPAGVEPA